MQTFPVEPVADRIAHIDEGILAYPVLMHQKAEQKHVAGLMLVNVARTPLPHLS